MKTKENLRWWHSPYSFWEKMDFLRYRLAAPSTHNTSGLPLDDEPMSVAFGTADGGTKVGFVGDFMPIGRRRLSLGAQLQDQLSQLDYIVLNVEGVLTHQRRYLAVAFDPSILEQICALFPQKIIFNVANNHSADFGSPTFAEHLEYLRRFGRVVGDHPEGLLLPEGIYIRCATMLSNQPLEVCDCISPEDATSIASAYHRDYYNIFVPHWGYEMHLYPERVHADFAGQLLDGGWDAIVGSHPHVPQPLWQRADGKICLFSLGNFCYENINPNHSYGKLLVLDIASSEGTPRLNAFHQFYTRQEFMGRDEVSVDLAPYLDYHHLRANTRPSLRYFSDLIK